MEARRKRPRNFHDIAEWDSINDFFDPDGQRLVTLRCKFCRKVEDVTSPVESATFVALSKAMEGFLKRHTGCWREGSDG